MAANISTWFSALMFALALFTYSAQRLGDSGQKLLVSAAFIFLLTAASGLIYAKRKKKIMAVIHSMLMISVAGLGLSVCWRIFRDTSWMGGSGPDANPAAGIAI